MMNTSELALVATRRPPFPRGTWWLILTISAHRSYESLPPNFSLLQNMAAGAFAGIAVSTKPLQAYPDLHLLLHSTGSADILTLSDRNIPSCTLSMLSRCVPSREGVLHRLLAWHSPVSDAPTPHRHECRSSIPLLQLSTMV